MPEAMYCYNHPERETLLRCGKCGRPICTECAIRHPVGLRCPQCAQLRKVPTYDVSLQHYLRALGAGLGASLLCGLAAEILPFFVPVLFLSFILALAAGTGIGEAINRGTGLKRGRGLQAVAVFCVIVGTIAATGLVAAFRFGSLALLFLPASLLNPYYWIYPIVAAVVVVMRLR
jgi:hypothetical protein